MAAMPDESNKADESLLGLVAQLPLLVRNLVMAELDAAKKWLTHLAKNAGIGAGWMLVALFVLFWSIPVLGTFVIAGLSSWWPVWLSALVVFAVMILVTAVLVFLGFRRFRKIGEGNPAGALAKDARIVKEFTDEF